MRAGGAGRTMRPPVPVRASDAPVPPSSPPSPPAAAIVHIHKTNIEGRSPRELCALRDKELHGTGGVFYSDCRPDNKTKDPYFRCDCCTDCCDHTTQVCIADD